MEGQDQYQAACMNNKGLTDFKCPKKLIEQKVRVYTSPTVLPQLIVFIHSQTISTKEQRTCAPYFVTCDWLF